MRIASLLGGAFTLHDVAAITGRSVLDVAGVLRDASLAGLVVGDGERLTFRHDLVREAVYHHMLPAERRDLHRAAAQALASAGAPTQQVAEQYVRGALPGDVEAVRWLERAADETTSLEPSIALSMLERASTLVSVGERAAIRVRTIGPLVTLGRLDEADAVAARHPRRCAAGGPRVRRLARPAAGRSRPWSVRRGVRLDEPRGRCTRRARRRATPPAGASAPTTRCCSSSTVEETRHVIDDLLVQARAAGDLPTECVAQHGLGIIAMVTGHIAASQEHFTARDDAVRHRTHPAGTFVYSLPHTLSGFNLLAFDDIDGAIEASNRVRARSDASGVVSPLPLALGVSPSAGSRGQWDDAIADCEAGHSCST